MANGSAVKKRRITPPPKLQQKGSLSPVSEADTDGQETNELLAIAAHWNLEQNYEQRPRKKRKEDKEATRLPIKTPEGTLQQSRLPEIVDDEEGSSTSTSDGNDENASRPAGRSPVPGISKLPIRQQIVEAKEELARIAGLLNEDPEENVGAFRTLSHFASSPITTIQKLALATQLAVFKDVIPGYRIRPLSEDDENAKVSKDVRRLRNFEQSLVGSYQTYVRMLSALAKGSKGVSAEDARSLSTVAKSCACALVIAVPHFNFRGELLKILVDQLSSKKVDDDFAKCRETLETLFRDDEDGTPSLDAVGLLTRMMKARHYYVDESVLNTFLHLRLLSDFFSKGSQNKIDDPSGDNARGHKKIKEKREFRTKRQRKLVKENKVIAKEYREADATVGHEVRDKMQAETLKLVFVTYFRILKARTPGLMGAVLEGLAKYAHLINQDFFVDLLEALKDLIGRVEEVDADAQDPEQDENTAVTSNNSPGRNPTRESLLCIITAFALLQGQTINSTTTNARALNLDLNFFISHLYRTLQPLSINPDLELSRKSLHLPDPSHNPNAKQQPPSPLRPKVNVQTTTILLLRSLSSVLLPASNVPVSAIPPLRLAAFTKQLMTASLHLPEKSCLAMLDLLRQVTKTHRRKVIALWNTEERKGDGVFDPTRAQLEGSNPYASTIWEGELLRYHFCPALRESARALEKGILETG
ncbi:MAG: hypothetical protein M1837_006161 [Sclerophora amabilis]|nr:MAG: hypothetical protein M1837_006161 [Sclerophora amabilis]